MAPLFAFRDIGRLAVGPSGRLDSSPSPQGGFMAIAEGKTLPFTGPEAIDVSVLETFE
jgi:hypothetical protein